MLDKSNDKVREQGTCDWVKENAAFQSWIREGGVIWFRGKGGSGKEMLMDHVID